VELIQLVFIIVVFVIKKKDRWTPFTIHPVFITNMA